jgi:hypothetical protein
MQCLAKKLLGRFLCRAHAREKIQSKLHVILQRLLPPAHYVGRSIPGNTPAE